MSERTASVGPAQTITGMRGGLGRTLLSAFLLFTIVPLAMVSFLAVDRARQDLRQEVILRLTAVAQLKEAQTQAWVAAQNDPLAADLAALGEIMVAGAELGVTGEAYLVSADLMPLTPLRAAAENGSMAPDLRTEGVEAALAGGSGAALYDGYDGRPVVGVYRWLPSLQAALIVEQAQSEAFARGDALATRLIGATLAVALLTTLLAAVITRRLSRPIVQLTLSAVRIAGGDLEQAVMVERRDEIGILGQAFNIMTAELRALYHGLEQKVAERTAQLEEANQQLCYQAMQLALSAELGRAITSILDLDELLQTVVELIHGSYRLRQVGIYLFDKEGRRIVKQASIGWDGSRIGDLNMEAVHSQSVIGLAVADGCPHGDDLWTNVAIPLRAGQRVMGVLKLQAYRGDELAETDIDVLQTLGDQVSIAVQNAQTYAVEKGTVERLHRLDQIRTRSLSSMSRELATSLNSIIGFSRLILKGIDGPLTEQQHSDVMTINRSGQHLQGLLDDVLELIDLENGDQPLQQQATTLSGVVDDALHQVSSLAEGKAISLHARCPIDLPALHADGQRLRQAVSYLLSSAIEASSDGAITLGAGLAQDGDEVVVGIVVGNQDAWPNGNGESSALFEGLSEELLWDGSDIGIRLMLSKRIIELHGGSMWVSHDPSQRTRFVFTLPLAAEGNACALEKMENGA
ncbi:MAG: HAMP domain-containing protein [Chloroflexota bacterium]